MDWQQVQHKTFCRWLNHQLSCRPEIAPATDLGKDLSDGVRLINLLEVISNESLGRYAVRPKLRVQKAENVNKALSFIKSRGLRLLNIGAEDVLDGNVKIILGLVWTLILRFSIEEIHEEGLSAKEGLLLWAQRKTAPYTDVDIRDFSSSWSDGRGLYTDLFDYESFDKSNPRDNLTLAFQIASKELGIGQLLEVDDVCVARPDERSIMTYLAQMYTTFSALDKIETAGRRVERFIEVMQSTMEMRHSYEGRTAALIDAMRLTQREWDGIAFDGTYADAKKRANEHAVYKCGEKRSWTRERIDLAGLLGNIQTKLSTFGLREYIPPKELHSAALDAAWHKHLQLEAEYSHRINQKIQTYANDEKK